MTVEFKLINNLSDMVIPLSENEKSVSRNM